MAQSYEKAGVNLEAGYEVVRRIKKHVASTSRLGVMGNIGAFGGMFDLSALNVKEPVLVSGTDGVGTKLKIAMIMDKHDTIGIDCVAMCVNDVLALREADCSIAMASGSGVACQASHIVLLDSQFSALPSVVAEGRRVINNIERSASLYLVKNIFTFVLSLITLFFTLPYPYTPAQLSLVNALTIGIPSFILAMEPNENRISGRFMPNVIYRALPAALSDLILVVGVMLFYLAFHIKEDMLSTLCTGIMGIVGLLMVHQTSLPMNKLRKAMLVGLCIAFVVCYFFLPELFTLSALDKPSLLILVVLGLLAFSVMFVCRRGLRKAKARLDKGIFPHRKKR